MLRFLLLSMVIVPLAHSMSESAQRLITASSSDFSRHDDVTLKDRRLCAMQQKAQLIEACRKSAEFNKACAVHDRQPELMASQLESELKLLVSEFSNTTCGISRPGLWRVYVGCDKLLKGDARACKDCIDAPIVASKRSLLSLAEDLVTKSASDEYKELKVETLFRNHVESFSSVLKASFSLYVPMGRALKIAAKTGQSFPECFLGELQQGYWRDRSFSEAMRYIRDYVYFEFLYAQTVDDYITRYEGLTKYDAETLAHQFLANFILLNIVMPYVIENRGEPSTVKTFVGADKTALYYNQPFPERPFKVAAPEWYKIVTLLMGDSVHLSRTSSSLADRSSGEIEIRSPRRGTVSFGSPIGAGVEKVVRELNEAFVHASGRLDADTLGLLIDEYIRGATHNASIIIPTRDLVHRYYKAMIELPESSGHAFEDLHAKFVVVQDLIRSLEHWHINRADSIFDVPYTGQIKPYLSKFSDGNWEEKTAFFVGLARLSMREPSEELKNVVTHLAHVFAPYAEYLYEDELVSFLQILSELDLYEPFLHVEHVLERVEGFSSNPLGLRRIRESLHTKMSSASSSTSRMPEVSRKRPLRKDMSFKYANGSKKELVAKIHFPVDRGIGEIVNTLKQSSLFVGADQDMLMMVARLAEPRTVKKNEVLYGQGDRANTLALITQGELDILVNDGRNNNRVATLKAGQTVGDMSLFNEHAVRSATVKARTYTTIYEISNEAFKRFMLNQPKLMTFMYIHLAQKVAIGQRSLMEAGLFTPSAERSPLASIKQCHSFALAAKWKKKKLNKGTQLVKAGKVAKKLFYVDAGELILSGERGSFDSLKAGQYLDQIDFFLDGVYPYAVQANPDEDCLLSCIDKKDFMILVTQHPEMLWPMSVELSRMVQDNNERLKNTQSYKLQLACENGKVALATEALSSGSVNVDAPCPVQRAMNPGSRPLHIAAQHNNLDVLLYLLSQGAKVDEPDDRGNTALHIAAAKGHARIVEQLLRTANPEPKNAQLETPLKLARDGQHTAVIELLQSRGCLDESAAFSGQ